MRRRRRLLNFRASQFTPSNIADMQLFFETLDPTTVTQAGGLVTQLADKSGNANHATAGGVNRPTFVADGFKTHDMFKSLDADDRMVTPYYPQGINTIYIVAKYPESVAGERSLFGCQSDGDHRFNVRASTASKLTLGWGTTYNTPAEVYSPDEMLVIKIVSNGTTVSMWVNGNLVIDAVSYLFTGTSTDPVYLMGRTQVGVPNGSWRTGHFGSVLLYDRTLTADEQAQVENYIYNTWDIQTTYKFASSYNPIYRDTVSRTLVEQVVRWPHRLGSDQDALKVLLYNFTVTAAGEAGTGNAYTVQDMSIERDSDNQVIPIKFGGLRAKAMADNADIFESDTITPEQFGLSGFKRGEVYWIKARVLLASAAHKLPFSTRNVSLVTGTQVAWYDPAATTESSTDIAGVYTFTGTTPVSDTRGFDPLMIGLSTDETQVYVAVGDSITMGAGETADVDETGIGYFQRAMVDIDKTSNPIPSANLAVTNTNVADYIGGTTKWAGFLNYANVGITALGTNDFGTVATDAELTTLKAETQTLWGHFDTASLPIIGVELWARASSTDLWATTANQTVMAGWTEGSYTDQFNDWLATKVVDGTLRSVVSTDNARDTTEPDKWVVNGSARYSTFDGSHPSTGGHKLIAEALRLKL